MVHKHCLNYLHKKGLKYFWGEFTGPSDVSGKPWRWTQTTKWMGDEISSGRRPGGNRGFVDLFPRLSSICANPEVKIEEIRSLQSSLHSWNVAFRTLLNVWEMAREAQFLTLASGFRGTNLESDNIRHYQDGVFSVNKVYKRDLIELTGRSIGPWKTICRVWHLLRWDISRGYRLEELVWLMKHYRKGCLHSFKMLTM